MVGNAGHEFSKMAVQTSFTEHGWYLSEEGLDQATNNGTITDYKLALQKAVDIDLKDYGAPILPDDINKGKLESITGNIVVQIQKIRNIAAPKANEDSRTAPRMIKLTLTDGHTTCHAIEIVHIAALSLNTPPGTKLRLKNETIPLSHGMIMLKPNLIEILGGKVAALVEKWELTRTFAKHTRGRIGEEGGPPPWIAFGQKILRSNPQDRNFKSLTTGSKENKENAEFESLRKDAIAEAAKAGSKKVFGGGNKPMLDHNVQQIVDLGYSVMQAEYALRQNKHNVERALRSLQRKDDGPRMRRDDGSRVKSEPKSKGADKKKGDKDDGVPSKPSDHLSLFDFLEDKLPVQNADKEAEKKPAEERRYRNNDRSGGDMRNSRNEGYYRSGGGGYSSNSRQDNMWSDNSSQRHQSYKDGERSRPNATSSQKPPRFQQQQAQRMHNAPNSAYNQSDGFQTWTNETYHNSSQTWMSDGYKKFGSYNSRTESNLVYNGDDFGSQMTNQYQGQSSDGSRRGYNRDNNKRNYNNKDYRTQGEFYGRDDAERGAQDKSKMFDEDGRNAGRPQSCNAAYDGSHNFRGGGGKFESGRGATQEFGGKYFQSKRRPASGPLHQSSYFDSEDGAVRSSYSSDDPKLSYGCNMPSNQYIPDSKQWPWKEGDQCMAKYWEDNMYYRAEVTGVSTNTCVVRFLEYGNYEEVLQEDCIPFTKDGLGHSLQTSSAFVNSSDSLSPMYSQNNFSGILEFRRGGNRPYIKAGENAGSRDNREKRGFRPQQQVYVPPAQRK